MKAIISAYMSRTHAIHDAHYMHKCKHAEKDEIDNGALALLGTYPILNVGEKLHESFAQIPISFHVIHVLFKKHI
jgi:hypothetical protein